MFDFGEYPNFMYGTFGSGQLWEELESRKGLHLQKNQVSGQCWILDQNDRCIAWGSESVMRETLKRLTRAAFLEPGDIIGVSRGVYEHFAVYLGQNQVIHYNGIRGKFSSTTIHKADFEEFLKSGRNYFVLYFEDAYHAPKKIFRYSNFFSGGNTVLNQIVYTKAEKIHLYTPEETIRRAKQRIGENGYNLFCNNCEHFALWCKTGVSMSFQVQRVDMQMKLFGMFVSIF